MYHLKPMPSPRGTNSEGLYLAVAGRPAMAAYDAMPKGMSRRARDDDPEAVARGISAMLLGLRDQLGDEAFRALCDKVCGDEPEEAEAEAEDDDPAAEFDSPEAREMAAAKDKKRAKDKKMGKDTPADFPGEPKTGAEDSATDPRFAFLTDAQRVKPDNGSAFTDRTSQGRRAPTTATGERSFEAMYGQHALNIKGSR